MRFLFVWGATTVSRHHRTNSESDTCVVFDSRASSERVKAAHVQLLITAHPSK